LASELQDVLEAMVAGVLVLDDDGCVLRVNTEASRILETSSEGMVGERLEALLGEDHPIARLARGAHEDHHTTIQRDIALADREQGRLEADVAVAPLGRSGAVVTLRDRTIANSLRQEMSERQLLAAFGRIAAGIAHEVKNPLGGIRGAAELLESRAEAPSDRDMAGLIVREVDRISSLVDELMVFARGERLSTTTINLHRVLDAVLELLALDPLCEGAQIERIYDPSIPEFLADPDRLKQVFLNLARNALQAMNTQEGSDKTLSVSTRMALGRHLPAEDGRPVPALEVRVSDTGPGIEPDVLERLATPFFTTRADGHGLGLAVSRHWVMLHGGSLKIESVVAKGTSARVLLPLRRAAVGACAETHTPESRFGSGSAT
jgi:two-component system nitrogen regulation sensor histidine kinase GlnL